MTKEVSAEIWDLNTLKEYSPSQILFNSNGINKRITDIIKRNTRNKSISSLGEVLLKMNHIYERNYQCTGTLDLDSRARERYLTLLKQANQLEVKAKNSICDFAIKVGDVSFVEAYDRLVKKIQNLEYKISKKGATQVDNANLFHYRECLRQYYQMYASSNLRVFG